MTEVLPLAPKIPGHDVGPGWQDLSGPARLTVAGHQLRWQGLGLGPQGQRVQETAAGSFVALCTEHTTLQVEATVTKGGRDYGPGLWHGW